MLGSPGAGLGRQQLSTRISSGVACPRYEGMCQELAENLRSHQNGTCRPCVAFAFRESGCFKGDACSHCHFCTAEEAAERRRQLQSIARRRRRMRRLEAQVNQEEPTGVADFEPGRIGHQPFPADAAAYSYLQPLPLQQVPLQSAPSSSSQAGVPWTATIGNIERFPDLMESLYPWTPEAMRATAPASTQFEAAAHAQTGSNAGSQSFWL